MMTINASFDLGILYFVAANVIAILGYVMVVKYRTRRLRANVAAITAAASDFFGARGSSVSIECTGAPPGRGYVVLIESASSKRFRHSHVVEMILRDHIRETCGLELRKVFWRFPIPSSLDVPGPAPATVQKTQQEQFESEIDDYLNEGVVRLRELPRYEVTEGSLEDFEQQARHTH